MPLRVDVGSVSNEAEEILHLITSHSSDVMQGTMDFYFIGFTDHMLVSIELKLKLRQVIRRHIPVRTLLHDGREMKRAGSSHLRCIFLHFL